MRGITFSCSACFVLLGITAALVQTGKLKESRVNLLLLATVMISSLVGSLAAGRGKREIIRIQAAIPGGVLAFVILLGRSVGGYKGQGIAFTLLLAVSAIIPVFMIRFGRPFQRRR